jgi:gamma-glutamyltranspeptidase/glutathione hydrolase
MGQRAHGGGGGAIAAGHVVSAEAGAVVLAAGGNACDALVAAALASWVAEPTLTGPCGGGFLVYREAATGRVAVLDFFAAAPGLDAARPGRAMDAWDVEFGTAVQRFWFGVGSCAVPGTAAGVGAAHARWGSLPWASLVEPAIALASSGVVVSEQQAIVARILAGILTSTPGAREVFAPTGALLEAGDVQPQPALARTLARLAEHGVDDLYRGGLAAEVARFFAEAGGTLGAADLAAYRVISRRPLVGRYRDVRIVANPPPSSGGTLVGHALAVQDRLASPADPLGLDAARTLAVVLREAERRRTPAFARALRRGGARRLLDEELVAEAAGSVARELAGAARPVVVGHAPNGTTHISVVDARGNAAAMTCSTGCGSGVFVGDTGLHMNNMLGEEDLTGGRPLAPGARLTSMMTPALLTWPDGSEAVVGSSGSARIRSALQRVITALVDHGCGAREAIDLPRVHPSAAGLDCEHGFPEEVLDALEAAGEPVVRWPDRNVYFGGTQVARRHRDGTLEAAGDPRRGGHGMVVEA